ncbi:MAG TPA: HD domain-containing protein [Candidatus Dormibacteraeota bacterium]|nr:HD domain-containing protein [Candidatus Dormibacteraeota bacterium]
MAGGPERVFEAVNLLADPIYEYCQITKQLDDGASSEQALLDHPWLQRQRRVHQLQSAWWVFHTAEHSRFQHAVGAMHLTGLFTSHLYRSLKESFPGLPSEPLVVETMRIAGLLHDVGHGPFGHFFDSQVLKQYGIDHEDIGRALVLGPLADLISTLRRSPEGTFGQDEAIDPRWVAFVMAPAALPGFAPPLWLAALKPVLCGAISTDNMDYVPRDAYMCGVAVGPVDLPRLRHYMFIKDGALVLHQHGAPALEMFLSARLYMYNHVYFHRTVRRIDLHLRPVFAPTCEGLLPPGNPLDHLEEYLRLTDWSLMAEVERLQLHPRSQAERELGDGWRAVTQRRLPWRLVFEAFHELSVVDERPDLRNREAIEASIRAELPSEWSGIGLEVDLASTAPRPENPAIDGQQLSIFDPITERVEVEAAPELMARLLPLRTVWLRVYSDDSAARAAVRAASQRALAQVARGIL